MATPKPTPTEDAPELGAIKLFGIVLSEGERWVQDDDHVFRSTEFDVIAAAPTFKDGLHRFGSRLLEFMGYLAALEDPAENESEMLRLLQPRIVQIVERAKEQADEIGEEAPQRTRRTATATRSRQRGDHGSQWQPTSKRRTSSKLSPA
jgi:hypothetical protein